MIASTTAIPVQALQPTSRTNATCGCHIGYVHMNDMALYDVFGDGVLERIPADQRAWQRRRIDV